MRPPPCRYYELESNKSVIEKAMARASLPTTTGTNPPAKKPRVNSSWLKTGSLKQLACGWFEYLLLQGIKVSTDYGNTTKICLCRLFRSIISLFKSRIDSKGPIVSTWKLGNMRQPNIYLSPMITLSRYHPCLYWHYLLRNLLDSKIQIFIGIVSLSTKLIL